MVRRIRTFWTQMPFVASLLGAHSMSAHADIISIWKADAAVKPMNSINDTKTKLLPTEG
jgi:hypothetical protein